MEEEGHSRQATGPWSPHLRRNREVTLAGWISERETLGGRRGQE